MTAVTPYTPQQIALIKEQRKERRKNYNKNLSWRNKVNKAIYKIHEMGVSRYDRLLKEKMRNSGYNQAEIDFILKRRRFQQPPIVEEPEAPGLQE